MTDEHDRAVAPRAEGLRGSDLMKAKCDNCPHAREDHPDGAACRADDCDEFVWRAAPRAAEGTEWLIDDLQAKVTRMGEINDELFRRLQEYTEGAAPRKAGAQAAEWHRYLHQEAILVEDEGEECGPWHHRVFLEGAAPRAEGLDVDLLAEAIEGMPLDPMVTLAVRIAHRYNEAVRARLSERRDKEGTE